MCLSEEAQAALKSYGGQGGKKTSRVSVRGPGITGEEKQKCSSREKNENKNTKINMMQKQTFFYDPGLETFFFFFITWTFTQIFFLLLRLDSFLFV